jgi:hypothetical protein
MKQLLCFFLTLISFTAHSQTNRHPGKSPYENPSYGKEFDLQAEPERHFLDTLSKQLVVVTKPVRKYKGGKMVLFDLNTNTKLWEITLDNPTLSIHAAKNSIIQFDGRETHSYSKKDGTRIWHQKERLSGVIPESNLAISQNGHVFDIEKGREIANGGVSHKYGINHVEYSDKKTALVGADGLYAVDLVKGGRWSHETKTGWKYYGGGDFDPGNTAIIVASSVAFGMVGGLVAMAATGSFKEDAIAHDGGSNIVAENNRAYFASLESLMCVDVPSGNQVFNTTLNGAKTSLSNIKLADSNIYLLNYGFVPANRGKYITCGHPFFASYNKFTGAQNYLDSIGPRGWIPAANYIGDTLFVNYNNTLLAAYDIKTGDRVLAQDMAKANLSFIVSFINHHRTYVEKKGGSFEPLSHAYPGVIFMRDKNNLVYTYNTLTNATGQFAYPVWEPVTLSTNVKIMRNEKAVVVLKDDKNAAVLNIENAIIAGDKIIGFEKNKIQIVDINTVQH